MSELQTEIQTSAAEKAPAEFPVPVPPKSRSSELSPPSDNKPTFEPVGSHSSFEGNPSQPPPEASGAGLKTSSSDEWKLDFSKYKQQEQSLIDRPKEVREFYERQNELIESFGAVGNAADEEVLAGKAKMALKISFMCNVALFIFKIYAAIATNSLSVIASALDSALDLCSGFVLWLTSRATIRKGMDYYYYPVGKLRFEPVGVIVFSCIMGVASLQVIIEGLKQLFLTGASESQSLWGVIVLATTVGVKVLLFLYCRTFKDSPSVSAYAQDHLNDSIMCTTLTVAVFVSRYVWWLDPLAATLISIYIISNWVKQSYEQMKNLVGESAPPEFLQQLTFICLNHDPRLTHVDTVRAFHVGHGYFVEVDIVLPKSYTLEVAHDVGESLQMRLEQISQVERAFVHVDYSVDHKPEHKHV